jgi:hypothetical protein
MLKRTLKKKVGRYELDYYGWTVRPIQTPIQWVPGAVSQKGAWA